MSRPAARRSLTPERNCQCENISNASPAGGRLDRLGRLNIEWGIPVLASRGFGSPAMQEYISRFGDHLRYERNVSEHTLRNYMSDLEQFLDFICPLGPSGDRREVDVKQI